MAQSVLTITLKSVLAKLSLVKLVREQIYFRQQNVWGSSASCSIISCVCTCAQTGKDLSSVIRMILTGIP